MKRLAFPVLMASLAVLAFALRSHWLPQPPGQFNYLGYVEGETVLVGAPEDARIVSVLVTKGQPVKSGSPLFELDAKQARSDAARAEAAVKTARALYDNLLIGGRPEEIAVIQAQIAQTVANLEFARKQLRRASTLATSGTAAQARLDEATQQVMLNESRLLELRASEQVAGLAARPNETAAAASRIVEAEAQLKKARDWLSDLSPSAPVESVVEDVFFKAGEWVAAGQPVVSLLTPSDIMLRFFLPQHMLTKAAPGTKISFRCDGCDGYKAAVISHVTSQPEYSPPVIYSETARAKLVYLVEAKPIAPDPKLRPGLPIEVEPLQ